MGDMSGLSTLPDPEAGAFAMRETEPSVHLIARPSVDVGAMRAYLEDVGGVAWLERRLGEAPTRPTTPSCSWSSAAAPATGAGSPG